MPFNDEYGVRHSQQLLIGFQVQGATHWQWPETQIKCCLELSQGKVLEQTAPFQPTLKIINFIWDFFLKQKLKYYKKSKRFSFCQI